jgi:YNFM family putative membrane transporter
MEFGVDEKHASRAISAVILGIALFIAITHIPSLLAVAGGLSGTCLGFFSIHAAAGSLNQKLNTSRGRANALCVLFYYLGGAVGITISGYAYQVFGWIGVTGLGMLMLAVILPPVWWR